MRIGNISSLPIIIVSERIIFEKSEKKAKLQVGPTSSKPGPILLMHVITAETVVVRSYPSMDIRIVDKSEITQYAAKKRMVLESVRSDTVRLSMVTILTLRGCMSCFISRFIDLHMIMLREVLIPPPVEPAQAPVSISIKIITFEKVGQTS